MYSIVLTGKKNSILAFFENAEKNVNILRELLTKENKKI